MKQTMTINRSTTVTTTNSSAPRSAESPDAFHLYLREIGPLPLLTREEEITLARRVKKGDQQARERMIQGNLRLVVKIARDYENLGMPLLDLIAEGNIGLMRAVDRFDPSRGAKLSVYASFWIKQCIRRSLGNQSRTIRMPIHVHAKLVELDRATRRLQEILGRAPTDAEVAQETSVPASRLTRLRQASVTCSSLDAPLGDDAESTLAELIADDQAATPYEQLAGDSMRSLLNEMVAELTPRELFILRLRYGLDGAEEHTLLEVSNHLGVTRERVRQIQHTALQKLHQWISKRESETVATA